MEFFNRGTFRLAAIIGASVAFGALAGGTAMANQPHMWNALHALQNADNQLQLAEPDKGGHRVNAINLVNEAISEVQAGIQAGA